MRDKTLLLVAAAIIVPTPAAAQMVDIPIWSNGILGQQALRNTYDNYDRSHGVKKGEARSRASRECSADALPAAERSRIEQEYVRRVRDDGKASADGWVQEQGRRFYTKLAAEGVCPKAGSKDAQVADNWRSAQ
ncbi:MAG: hypothetical protein ABW164_07155 [Sphingobium sp.]